MTTLSSLRNAQLLLAARAERRRCPDAPMKDVVARVLGRPVAQGYFVGVDHAIAMLRAMRGQGLPEGMSALRRLMWNEIGSKVADRQRRTGCSMVDAVAHVLGSATASRFFVQPSTALRIVYTGRA